MKGKYKENTQYVLSYYGKILDNSNANNYRIRVYYTDNTYTDGVVTGNKYEKRIIKTLSGKTVYKIIGYYGSMNGDFIVNKCDKKDILIKEPLRGFDENTCDIMHEDNGQVKINRQIGEYKITGDELINRQSESAYTRFTIDNIPGANRTVGRHFIINSKVNFLAEGNKPMVGFLYNGSFFFYINNQNTDTVEMAREFIKGTTLYYQLATPTVKEIDLDNIPIV
ncbi:hypothetical protein ACSW9L_17245 (plasmid) [Clostridium perfringens]